MVNELKDNGTVLTNDKLNETAELYDMLIEAPEVAKWAMPGQIVHVLCGEGTTLRRPISICETVGDCVRLCYEVRGKGTDWMAKRKPGDKISILGALGHGFSHKKGERALLVGGGIGIYPLLSIGKKVKADGDTVNAAFGFRNIGLVNYVDEFKMNGIDVSVITDDGSNGRKGFVTELVKEALDAKNIDVVYVCGPRGMMAAVAALCEAAGVRCEVSMEERMGCGVGACLACVCKTMFKDNEGVTGEKYKRVCMDGPVFDSKEIIWK